MQKARHSKKGLSTVVTTLIILVVSVVLAGVVTLYATNITSTRTQQETLKMSKQAIWVDDAGNAIAAVCIDNVGGKDVVIDKITVRGVEAGWSSVHYLRLGAPITESLNFFDEAKGDSWSANFTYAGASSGLFTAAANDVPLASGNTLVVYITSPDSINLSDVGVTIGITGFTAQAQYYVETNVRAAISAP